MAASNIVRILVLAATLMLVGCGDATGQTDLVDDTRSADAAAAPPSESATTPPATAPAGTALERSGDRVQGMVDVGGYRLYLDCIGSGEPAVVLEAGFSGGASVWSRVQPALAETTRVCAYDRAGRGKSDRGPNLNTSGRMVADLHTALATAGIPAPFILVGQSFGGLNVQLYARLHPDQVAGLVLVDVPHEERYLDPEITPNDRIERVDVRESGRQLQAAPPLPDIPLIVLTAGRLDPSLGALRNERWAGWQEELTARSPRGRQVVVANAGHNIHREQSQAVIDAIREVVEEVRRR